eukprot:Awhi_evm1s9895
MTRTKSEYNVNLQINEAVHQRDKRVLCPDNSSSEQINLEEYLNNRSVCEDFITMPTYLPSPPQKMNFDRKHHLARKEFNSERFSENKVITLPIYAPCPPQELNILKQDNSVRSHYENVVVKKPNVNESKLTSVPKETQKTKASTKNIFPNIKKKIVKFTSRSTQPHSQPQSKSRRETRRCYSVDQLHPNGKNAKQDELRCYSLKTNSKPSNSLLSYNQFLQSQQHLQSSHLQEEQCQDKQRKGCPEKLRRDRCNNYSSLKQAAMSKPEGHVGLHYSASVSDVSQKLNFPLVLKSSKGLSKHHLLASSEHSVVDLNYQKSAIGRSNSSYIISNLSNNTVMNDSYSNYSNSIECRFKRNDNLKDDYHWPQEDQESYDLPQ